MAASRDPWAGVDLHTTTDAANISFRQLRLFESLGRLHTMSRVAAESHLTQPAVTTAMTKLERQLRVPLFNRRPSGSHLNEYGIIFHRRVQGFVQQVEDALLELRVPGGREHIPVFARRLTRANVRALLAIIHHASLQQAAEKLGFAPGGLQRSMREFEQALERPLFHQSTDGYVVNQAGLRFGRRLRLAIKEIEWGIAEVNAQLGNPEMQLVIGALPSGGSLLLSAVLEAFLAKHPGVSVQVANSSFSSMITSLREGAVDLVIGLVQQHLLEGLVAEPLAPTPLAIAVRRGHDLLRRKNVTVADLRREEWIVNMPGSYRRQCFDRLFAQGERPRVSLVSANEAVTRRLLRSGNRLTIVTRYELMHESEDLVELPFAALEPVPQLGIIMRDGWRRTALHEAFMAEIRREMCDLSLPTPMRRAS